MVPHKMLNVLIYACLLLTANFFLNLEIATGMEKKTPMSQQQYQKVRKAVLVRMNRIKKPEKTPPPDWAVSVYEDYTKTIIEKTQEVLKSGNWIRIAEMYDIVVKYDLQNKVSPLKEEQKKEMITFLQGLQDKETGIFKQPDQPGDYRWHHHIRRLLYVHGAEPLYPECRFSIRDIPAKGMANGIDLEKYLEITVKDHRWEKDPWGVGSHSGSQCCAIMQAISTYGQIELIPVLEKGINNILAHLDPRTGMFGGSGTLMNRMSGCLKEWLRLYGYMGMEIPYQEQLANTLIKHHKNGDWWKIEDVCLCRNVAILAHLCLEHHRREEFYEIIYTAAKEAARRYQNKPDCFPGEFYILPIGLAWNILNWERPGLFHQHGNDFGTNRGFPLEYKLVLQENNTVKVVPKRAQEFPWHPDFLDSL